MDFIGLQCITVHCSGLQCITVDFSAAQWIAVDCSAGGLVDWHCSTAGTHPPESLPWITSTKLINFLSRPDLRMIAPLFFFLNLQNWPGFPWAKGYKKKNILLKVLLLKGPQWHYMHDFCVHVVVRAFCNTILFVLCPFLPKSIIIFFFIHF